MSAALPTALAKGFAMKTTGDYRPILADKRVIAELQIKKDASLVLWLRTMPTDPKLRKAVTPTKANKKWAARMDVTGETLPVARQILEAAAAAVPVKASAKKVPAKKPAATKA